jgi:two-component system phosphate regulon sensor histidine kinase PhoR
MHGKPMFGLPGTPTIAAKGAIDRRRSGVRRIVLLVSVVLVGPALLLLCVGILVLVFGRAARDYVFGILILGLVFTLITGIVGTLIYLKREVQLAKLQTDFVSKVSHELRTPLTSIRMFIETLQLGRAKNPASVQQCLDVLSVESARLSTMIDRLLGWACMEAGKRRYRPESCAPSQIVQAAIAAFGPQQLTHPVSVDVELQPALPNVLVDRLSMVEVLLNLLQNAYRYTDDEKHIAIRCACDHNARTVTIQVDDNGPGIAMREQHRIFEKFYRAEDPLKRDIPGTGLGLAIVQHIVHGNGGTVSVESEVGRGSSFRVVLPAVGGKS